MLDEKVQANIKDTFWAIKGIQKDPSPACVKTSRSNSKDICGLHG